MQAGVRLSEESVSIEIPENQSRRFIRVEAGVPSEMGESWLDLHSGLIWGDFLKTSSGKVDLMNRKVAERRCEAIGARLPSKQETYTFLQSLGYSWSGPSHAVTDDFIPNLTHEQLESDIEELVFPILWFSLENYQDIRGILRAKDPLFWTSTLERSYHYEYGMFCNSQTGRVLKEKMNFRGAGARCVILLPKK